MADETENINNLIDRVFTSEEEFTSEEDEDSLSALSSPSSTSEREVEGVLCVGRMTTTQQSYFVKFAMVNIICHVYLRHCILFQRVIGSVVSFFLNIFPDKFMLTLQLFLSIEIKCSGFPNRPKSKKNIEIMVK